ncbi:hypothetical protein Pan216_41720 [Planctomycetes bacterium Pan216]|uniref:Oligosaccharide repeat unit polymerase n=1 Tax=Kolteria novifilia TaxID=2527975 RepID=A0A518B8I3_9BACT|nr:hypothetical protein Pan216_41720 [Planctomycetes bacterium Pan216]
MNGPPSNDIPSMASLRILFRPSTAFVAPLFLGIAFWLLPLHSGTAGYIERAPLTVPGLLVLCSFYLAIYSGSRIARRLFRLPEEYRFTPRPRLELAFYFTVSAASTIGALASWDSILSSGLSLKAVFAAREGNEFKSALYSQYSYLFSLRYMAPVSGAMAFLFLLGGRFRRWTPLHYLNAFVLLSTAFISSRMALVQAIYYFAGASIVGSHPPQLKSKHIIVALLVMAILLTAMTYVRNANSYEREFGITSPIEMLFLQIRRYLSTPVQVSLGVSSYATKDRAAFSLPGWKYPLLPTFLHDSSRKTDNSGGVWAQWYLGLVDFDPRLTTNSSFVELYGDIRYWTIPFIFAVSFVWTGIAGVVARDDSRIVVHFVIVYHFAELWRNFHFNNGNFILQFTGCAFALLVSSWVVNSVLRLRTTHPT